MRCGEPHLFEQCPKKDSPKCINCGGAHSAAYGGCDAAKTATEIQKVKVEKKITYAQAAKIVTEKTKHNNDEGPTQPTKENTKSESSKPPNSKENEMQTDQKPSVSINENIPHTFNSGPPPTTKAQHISTNEENPTQNPLQENKPSHQEEFNRSKHPFSIENSDTIVTLIMAIISVFTKDMKNIDEMYNINMIKVAAERLLQI